VHALAVVDGGDRLLGIVTTTDILQAALRSDAPARIAVAPVASSDDSSVPAMRPEQLERALATASAAVSSAADPDLVHVALLFVHARMVRLERVRQLAARYLQAGQDIQLHAALKKALEEFS
jgi:hypothetical protein